MFWAAIALAWTLQASLHAPDTLGMHASLQHCSNSCGMRAACTTPNYHIYLGTPQDQSHPIPLVAQGTTITRPIRYTRCTNAPGPRHALMVGSAPAPPPASLTTAQPTAPRVRGVSAACAA